MSYGSSIFLGETLADSLPKDDSGLHRESSVPLYVAGNIAIILQYNDIEVESRCSKD